MYEDKNSAQNIISASGRRSFGPKQLHLLNFLRQFMEPGELVIRSINLNQPIFRIR
jgi:hypothetical protein